MERLILNALLRREEVVMPGIGTLHHVRVSARCDKRSIIPPRNTVRYSRRVEGRTLVDMVAEAAGCDRQTAEEAYGRWRKRAVDGKTVVIDGVGRIAKDFFTPSDEFTRQLNRVPESGVRLPVRHGGGRWLILVSAVVVAGVTAVLWFCPRGAGDTGECPRVAAEQTAAAVTANEGARPETTLVPCEESVQSADNIAGDATGVVPGNDGLGAAGETALYSAVQGTVINMSSLTRTVRGRYYVVLGVFSTADNASRFIERTVTAHPEAVCHAYLFSDGKILISGFESDERAAAETFMKENRAICPEMWIFSK